MLFNSLEFLFFFIPVYLLYLVLQHRWQNRMLILASCLFYAAWNWKFLGVMFFSISIDYFCSHKIEASQDQGVRRFFLLLSVTVNFLILGIFKYFNFFITNLYSLFHLLHLSSAAFVPWKVILPLGISFYTFEAVSYVLDVYRRQVKAANNYWDYLLFVIYFPHLIAGPIMRAKSFMPQISAPRILNLTKFYEGCFLFFWGLFEKMYVADNLAKIVDPVFASAPPYQAEQFLLASYAFAFQILCDFDGYSNMARGLGKCMGFEIAINFNLPFFASNIQDFWNRWHITLSSWVRDYLYFPLNQGLARIRGNGRIYAALLISMTVLGLWHGAAWHFVFFGVYHGVLLVLCTLIRVHCSRWIMPKTSWGQTIWFWLRVIFTFHLVVFGLVIFRCNSMIQLLNIFTETKIEPLQYGSLWLRMAGFLLPLLCVQVWQFKSNDLSIIFRQNQILKIFIYVLMSFLIIGFGVMNTEEFIYFQF